MCWYGVPVFGNLGSFIRVLSAIGVCIAMSLCAHSTVESAECSRPEFSDSEVLLSGPEEADLNFTAAAIDGQGVPHLFFNRLSADNTRYEQKHAVLIDGAWSERAPPDTTRIGYSDLTPRASVGHDGSMAVTWIRRYGPSEVDAAILVSVSSSGENWSMPIVVEDKVDYRVSYCVAQVTQDSTIVAYTYGNALAMKKVVSGMAGERQLAYPTSDANQVSRIVSLVRANGEIWFLWTSSVSGWPIFVGQYLILEPSGSTVATRLLPSPNGADYLRVAESPDGVVYVTYSNSLNYGSALALLQTTDGQDWSGPLRVAGYDGGQNCTTSSILPLEDGSIHIVYSCEQERPDGSFAGLRYTLFMRTFSPGTGFCPEQDLGLPPLEETNTHIRVFPRALREASGRLSVVYAEGPQVWYTLKTIQLLRSVGIPKVSLELRRLTAESFAYSIMGLGQVGPMTLTLEYRPLPQSAWEVVSTQLIDHTSDSEETIVNVDLRSGDYQAFIRKLSNYEKIAYSAVLTLTASEVSTKIYAEVEPSLVRVCSTTSATITGAKIFSLAGRLVAESEAGTGGICVEIPIGGLSLARGTYFVRPVVKSHESLRRPSVRVILGN